MKLPIIFDEIKLAQALEEVLEIAKTTNCSGMMWHVLEWNEPAINFYEKYNTNLNSNQIVKYAYKNSQSSQLMRSFLWRVQIFR